MSLQDLVVSLIGSCPSGFEPLQYILVAAFGFLLVSSCVSLISGIFHWIGGM